MHHGYMSTGPGDDAAHEADVSESKRLMWSAFRHTELIDLGAVSEESLPMGPAWRWRCCSWTVLRGPGPVGLRKG